MTENGTNEADVAARMAEAASSLADSLREDQVTKTLFDFAEASEREDWHYIPRVRQGLPLKEMDGAQRQRTFALISTGLSPDAYAKTKLIIEIEQILGEMEGSKSRFPRDPELYYITIFGKPGGEAWGWRFEGHHISLNYTIVEGDRIAHTPFFFGTNPAEVRHGQRKGLRALGEEEDLGRELLFALDGDQREQAVIQVEAPADILTRDLPYVGDHLEIQGLSWTDMTDGQRQIFQALMETYVRRLPAPMSRSKLDQIQRGDAQTVHFAWAGGSERGQGHYYRIHGASFMAEYDNVQNDANHIHTVWRDTSNDFGADLLHRHYRTAHGTS